MGRNREKQVQDGAKERGDPSGTSKETQFQEEDRGPGLTFYSAMPMFHSEGDKNQLFDALETTQEPQGVSHIWGGPDKEEKNTLGSVSL